MHSKPSRGSLTKLAGLILAAATAVLAAPASAQLSVLGNLGTPFGSGSASGSVVPSVGGIGGPLSVSGLGGLTTVNNAVNGELLTTIQKTLYAGRNDPFYDVTGVSTVGKKPGDILKSRVVLAPHFPEATVTQIMYVSTDVNNKLVPVTGTVLVPKLDLTGIVDLPVGSVQGPLPTLPGIGELAGGNVGFPVGGPKYSPRPVVGITPGTRGMGDHCAPSQGFNATTITPFMVDYSTAEYHQLLLRGYVVAVTDYVGGGTKVPESYLVGRPEGKNGLDVIRAALKLPGTGATPQSMVGLTGYSQGGQAAAWAAQLQPTYAPELNVKGMVAGGVVTDMLAITDFFNQGGALNGGVLLAILLGFDNAYPELNLKAYMKPGSEKLFESARTQCIYQELAAYPGLRASDVTSPDVVSLPQWRARLAEQELGKIAPRVPMYVYHGTLDNIVPYQFGERVRDSWCARGTSVEFRSGPYEHAAGIFLGAPGGVQFLADRFAGKTPINNCKVSAQ